MLAEKKYLSTRSQKRRPAATGQKTITELFLSKAVLKSTTPNAPERVTDGSVAYPEEPGEEAPMFVLPTLESMSVSTTQDGSTHHAKPQKYFPIFDRKPLPTSSRVHILESEVEQTSNITPLAPPDILHDLGSCLSADVLTVHSDSELGTRPSAVGGTCEDPILLDATPVKGSLTEGERVPTPSIITPLLFAESRKEDPSREDDTLLDFTPIKSAERFEPKVSRPPRILAPIFSKKTARQGNSSSDDHVGLDSPSINTQGEPSPTPPMIAPVFSVNARKGFSVPQPSHPPLITDAIYPTRETQHIRGLQNIYASDPIRFQSRVISMQHTSPSRTSNIVNISSTLPTESPNVVPTRHFRFPELDHQDISTDDIQQHLNHPAILRFSTLKISPISTSQPYQEAWVSRWRPTCADQVLGNEQNALYLRQWLQALALHDNEGIPTATKSTANGKMGKNSGNKRPRITRAVQKKKARKRLRRYPDEDDWIVDDGDIHLDFSCDNDDADLDEGFCVEHAGPLVDTLDQSNLMNTILLVGPSGCGKTATVHACAEELGWEVFEVFPGIGKRSSAGLDHYIGDVGKNHLVRKRQTNRLPHATAPFSHLHSSVEVALTADKEARDTNHQPPTATCKTAIATADNAACQPEIRQSLVLLEEVDILFKDDAGFWPAVVNLIKDCKRPLIMTCTDITLIPTDDLPLQNVLSFNPCPTPLAVSYLQSMAIAEGCPVERSDLHQLYLSDCDDDAMLPADRSCNVSLKPDLRRAINQLQFWCSHSESFGSTRDASRDDLEAEMLDWCFSGTDQLHRQAVQHSDLVSFVDGELIHAKGMKAPAIAEKSIDGNSTDDELGHTIILATIPDGKEGMIADDAMQLSRGAVQKLAGDSHAFKLSTTLTRRGIGKSRSQISDALNALIPCPALQPLATVLEYEPWIRHMVRIDDRNERDLGETRTRRLRRVTRSGQGNYERYLNLPREQLEWLRCSKLGDFLDF